MLAHHERHYKGEEKVETNRQYHMLGGKGTPEWHINQTCESDDDFFPDLELACVASEGAILDEHQC